MKILPIKDDEAAFTKLVTENLDAVYSFVARYVGDRAEAEDIVQDVFIKVWKNLHRFDPKRNFRTWLFTIAKNTALDWLKKKKAVAFSHMFPADVPSFEETLPDERVSAPELFDQTISQRQLQAALAQLPDEYRLVVLLRLDSQLTFREIAEMIDKPLNTVKSHYRRAVSLLQESMAAPKK